jgi:Asp-tRNA(Asn)/Glu-tRNA(Gln) amidotransferase B subunit
VESHPDLVEAYLAGKRKLLRFFVGRVMKKDPSQDPKLVKSILVDVLEKKQEGR